MPEGIIVNVPLCCSRRKTIDGSNGLTCRDERRSEVSMKRIRGICVIAAVVVVPVLGLLFHTGTGTPSAFGIDSIAIVCPVGALEAMLGSRGIVLRGVACVVLTVLLVLLLGKVFCAWACPVPWLQKFFSRKKGSASALLAVKQCAANDSAVSDSQDASASHSALGGDHGIVIGDAGISTVKTLCASDGCAPVVACSGRCAGCGKALSPIGGARDGLRLDSRHLVLAGALGSSAIFGFPVFCLVCPIGLTLTVLIGIWHLFAFNETTWGLVVFPAILLLEVTLLRKWCTRFCPVSALLSLVSSGNRLFALR